MQVASAVALPGPKLGERSLHYRIVISAKGKNAVPIVAELIGVGVGRISVVLHAFSIGAPLPAAGLSRAHVDARQAPRARLRRDLTTAPGARLSSLAGA